MSDVFTAWMSGRTVRKHTMHVSRRENVAEHTWGVLMLLERYLPSARPELFKYLVLHDAGEAGACDVPAHLCWELPELKSAVEKKEKEHVASFMRENWSCPSSSLTEEELLVAEILDRAEFVLSCLYEARMGNQLVHQYMTRALDRVTATLARLADGQAKSAMLLLCQDLMRATAPVYKE